MAVMAIMSGAGLASCTGESGSDAAKTAAVDSVVKASVSDVVVGNIMARRSIRKYTEQRVGRDTLERILECGINAPNGMNQQNYEIKVVDDPASTAFLSERLKGLYKAPVYLFIAAGDQYDMSRIDVGLLSENICLAARAYGLGSINLGMPVRSMKEQPELLAKLGFSEHYELCLIVALGYSDETPEAKPRKREKVQFVTVE